VPSRTTAHQARKWWPNLKSENMRTILSSIPMWKEPEDTKDEGYLLCTLRELPDPMWGKFEEACEALRIPYRMTEHQETFADYMNAVAHCRGIVSHLEELSTGGLSCLEGYRIGKPVLLNDSPLHGGRDYFGNRASYFKNGDMEDFQRELLRLYASPSIAADCTVWTDRNFSSVRMVKEIAGRLESRLGVRA